jgi:hypothetical protein
MARDDNFKTDPNPLYFDPTRLDDLLKAYNALGNLDFPNQEVIVREVFKLLELDYIEEG